MGRKILIIDNDHAVLQIMQEALNYEGFEVVTSPTADDCKNLIRQQQIDLLIIDYLLDGINGGEICHQLKTCPEMSQLPVIIFSAYPKVKESMDRYGCDRFIPKPLIWPISSAKSPCCCNAPPITFLQQKINYYPT